MNYPDFYNKIETIKLQDNLSTFLGAFEDGIIEFSYLDIVKTAGHSCPTVLGAYLSTREALKVLYTDVVPQRGDIKVEFKTSCTDGVAGVIANVITDITGSTTNYGFKGIAGHFDRRHLMFFEREMEGTIKFTRRDTGASVEVIYDPSSISPDAKMSPLMQKTVQGTATKEEAIAFGKLWQDRVERISQNSDKVIRIISA